LFARAADMSMQSKRSTAIRAAACAAGALVIALGLAVPAVARAAAQSAAPDYSMAQAGAAQRADAKYVPMFDPTARWPATFQWKYNPANAPAQIDKASVVATLQAAFDKWSSQCNVRHEYAGETGTAPHAIDNPSGPDYQSVVGWGSLTSNSAWTFDWWQSTGAGGRDLVDADVLLSVEDVTDVRELDRVATHEFGHAIGLNHSNLESSVMAGPPLTPYNMLVAPQADDIRGCRCLYGLPAGASAPYVCQLPSSLDFGTVPIDASSAPKSVAFHNSGNAPLSIDNVSIGDASFRRTAGCGPGTIVPPGGTCTLQVAAAPQHAGAVQTTIQLFTNDGMYELPLIASGDAGAPPPPPEASVRTVDVIEFYNATLDHYFITWIDAEIANLDANRTPTRWTRTGHMFKAYVTPQPGTSQICRFYIPPADGNSHFFGRNPAECSAAQQEHPEFVLEDPDYMQLYVPTAGVCPAGSTPIYRLFNNRADVNHRYTTDRAVRDQMVAGGWIAEGDGPDRVVMCAPL
jgi:hypothetical protein